MVIFSLNRQIKESKVLSPPALPAQAADYCRTRESSCRELPKDPAEAVSHTEQCRRYSRAAASSCRGPGRPGGREQSIQAAPHTSSRAAAPAAGSEPACTCRGEASATHLVCAGWFPGCWFTESVYFLRVIFLFCLQTKPLLKNPYTDLWVFARGRINSESGDWWVFLFPHLQLIHRAHPPCSLTALQALFAKCCSLWQ